MYGKTKMNWSELLHENNWTIKVCCMAIHEWASIQDDVSTCCTHMDAVFWEIDTVDDIRKKN
jgi:hypothetical protein